MNAHSIAIRRANVEDASGLATVHVESWRTTYAGIVNQAYIDRLSVEERAEVWGRRLRDPSPTAPDLLVAEAPAVGLVGFVTGGRIRDPIDGFDAELYAVYLLKAAQRIGLGRRLVRDWAQVAAERGYRAAVVRVLAANPARRFYEHLGARHLREGELSIGGESYAEVWYGWDDLRDLAASQST
jgi:GNAT superfamily N-acetyltransferase